MRRNRSPIYEVTALRSRLLVPAFMNRSLSFLRLNCAPICSSNFIVVLQSRLAYIMVVLTKIKT